MAAGFVMTLGMVTVMESVIDPRFEALEARQSQAERVELLEGELLELNESNRDLRGRLLRAKMEKRACEAGIDASQRSWTVTHAEDGAIRTHAITVPVPAFAEQGRPSPNDQPAK